jgi:tetratricopeptide (TPR) repeat protein
MLRRVLADCMFQHAIALANARRTRRARWELALSTRLAPPTASLLCDAALALEQAGERDGALRYCEEALALNPELDKAHELLAGMFLHGEDYLRVLGRMHEYLEPRTYIEIGVEEGPSIALVRPGTLALGVDPEPKIAFPLPRNVRVFAQTSDDFFARRDVRAELGGRPLELAFIDGMHQFEYALRDFMNLERLCLPGSTILVHDCFPHDRRTAQRERETAFWSGDIWRLVLLLKKYRRDLSIHTIAAPPTGLLVIRKLDPSSDFIAGNLEDLCEEFMRLDYGILNKDRAGKLNLFPNDWNRIRALLDAPAAQLSAAARNIP